VALKAPTRFLPGKCRTERYNSLSLDDFDAGAEPSGEPDAVRGDENQRPLQYTAKFRPAMSVVPSSLEIL